MSLPKEVYLMGIDTDSMLERFMGNEELFLSFLRRLPEEEAYDKLIVAIGEKNVSEAFDWAHRLKSILGNLSIMGAYHSLFEIVEVLRSGDLPSDEQLTAFVSQYEDCLKYVKEL